MESTIEVAINVLHTLVIVLTPVALLILIAYLVKQSFDADLLLGIRSLAGALLPIIFTTFAFVFYKESFQLMGNINVLLGFFPSLVWALLLMIFLRYFINLPVPLSEFILSATFSVLVFGLVGQSDTGTILSYYYGMICGFLIYVFILGVPTFEKKLPVKGEDLISESVVAASDPD